MRFSNKHKAVVNIKTLPVDNLPEACVQNVILSEREDCHELLSPTVPLSVFHNFYVLTEEDWSQKMTQCSVQFGPARVLFVLLRDSSVFSLSSPFYLPRQFSPADPMNIMKPVDLRPSSLNGMFLNIATFNCSPFVIFDKDSDSESISGIEWEVLKLLSNTLNFKISLAELEGDRRWGARINGTISGGILKALADRKADIGVCNLWNVISRYDIVDFGPSNNEVTYTFIVPRPQLISYQWNGLVNIFSWKVWLCVLIAYLMCAFFFWLICSRCPINKGIGSVESLLTIFGMLTLTSWAVRTSNSSGRQLVTWWCVFVMLLTATYSSSIAARLTLPKYESRVDTIQQLVEQGFNWYDEEYAEHDKRNVYLNSDNYWQRELDQHFVSLSRDGILPALRSRKFAFPVQRWDSFFIYFDGGEQKYKEGLREMRVLKETISAFYVSLAFAKRSPFLHALQVPLLHIYEAGFTTHWTTKIVRTRMDDNAKMLLEERDVGDVHQLKKLSLSNLKPVFYILILGLLLSAALFISEMIYHWY